MARRKVWVPIKSLAKVTGAGSASEVDLLVALPLDLEGVGGLTISRIIGNVSFAPISVAVQSFSMAVGVFHEDQSAAEPSLEGDISANLMWSWLGRSNGAFIETASGSFTRVEERVYFDIRVQRKLQPNFQLVFIVQNAAGVDIVHTFGARTLLALP